MPYQLIKLIFYTLIIMLYNKLHNPEFQTTLSNSTDT